MRFQVSDFISGMMADNILATGSITYRINLEYTPGRMAAGMKANTLRIKSMVTEFTTGLMANNTQVGGAEANSMA